MTNSISTNRNFGNVEDQTKQYHGYTTHSEYITMRDGIRLAVSVTLPNGLPQGEQLPVLVTVTRYWRESELIFPLKHFIRPENINPRTRGMRSFFTGHGYALVIIDERGTGASFGVWPYPWSEQSLNDMRDIADWLIHQSWCNGRIGAFGISYLGTTAELFAVIDHPAVHAVVPMFNHPDPYTDVAYPGGIFNERFVRAWGEFDRYLDCNMVPPEFGRIGKMLVRGVKPVDEDRNRSLLTAAIQQHKKNGSMIHRRFSVTFRDEIQAPLPISLTDMSVRRFNPALKNSNVPIFSWGSWLDAGTGDAVLRRILTFPNAQRSVIGAWDHGGLLHASPYQKPGTNPDPLLPNQWKEILIFLDAYLKDFENGVRDQRIVYYYTLGKEIWQSSQSFPPKDTQLMRWYFAPEGKLSETPPSNTKDVADTFKVDFGATTGTNNRWWELNSMNNETVVYRNRKEAASHMLTYTSAPLNHDVEIAGYPIVYLQITSSENDGAFYIYLEDVHPNGDVTYVTDGQLRALHRKVSDKQQPYNLPVPYHTYEEQDAMPLNPGEAAVITFGLLPVSALIRRGHRIRVGLAGHDADTFVRVPETGKPVVLVHRSQQRPSYIDLPIIVKGIVD